MPFVSCLEMSDCIPSQFCTEGNTFLVNNSNLAFGNGRIHRFAFSGSPFLFTVGSFKDGGGAHKVRAAGLGLHKGIVDHPQTFNIYTREAGPGNLSVTIEGPSKSKIDFKDHKDDNCYVTYSVSKPGMDTV